MNSNEAKETAKGLLDTEFNEVNNNPSDYCRAMGWEPSGDATKRAVKKAGIMSYDDDELTKLTLIIVDLVMEDNTIDTEDIAENNKVSDFLTNCVASHILR